jgi:hypothetical protein
MVIYHFTGTVPAVSDMHSGSRAIIVGSIPADRRRGHVDLPCCCFHTHYSRARRSPPAADHNYPLLIITHRTCSRASLPAGSLGARGDTRPPPRREGRSGPMRPTQVHRPPKGLASTRGGTGPPRRASGPWWLFLSTLSLWAHGGAGPVRARGEVQRLRPQLSGPGRMPYHPKE